MEQRELSGPSRPKGGEAEFHPGGGSPSPGNILDGTGGPLPAPGKGVPAGGERVDPEEEDDLGLGRDVDSNTDSEKWAQGDGLEEQEFSIKEASFSEGSLKLKIQTTKRAKKPPKSLENYICPPEIRITTKQPGEQKATKLGKSSKGAKEDVLPKKKIYEKPYKPPEHNEGEVQVDFSGETMKPKYQSKNTLHHLEWSTTPAGGSNSQGTGTETEPIGETTGMSKSSAADTVAMLPKQQLNKSSGGPAASPFRTATSSQVTGTIIRTPGMGSIPQASNQPESTGMSLSMLNHKRVIQEVAEQMFGNIKRKYGRKDSIRSLGSQNLGRQWINVATKESEGKNQENITEKYVQPDKTTRELPSGDSAFTGNGKEKEGDSMRGSISVQTQASTGQPRRKRRYRQSLKGQFPLENSAEKTLSKLAEKDEGSKSFLDLSPTCFNKKELRTSRVDEKEGQPEAVEMTQGETPENGRSRLRKQGVVGRPKLFVEAGRSRCMQAEVKRTKQKAKQRWTSIKSKNTSLQTNGNSLTTVVEPPSAFPITPSSPLYTNTDSLTVITPLKKKRGRPKKQPLLTVETIHEGTSTSPISPIAREPPGAVKKRRKKRSLAKLVQIASANEAPANHVKLNKKVRNVGVLDKKTIRTINKMKMVKRTNILNEILSCSTTSSSLAIKSKVPLSGAGTTVASTIEARLGKQINVSKRGTIYIGKKRGRKPRAEVHLQQEEHKVSEKHPVPVLRQYENPAVPSNPQPAAGMPLPGSAQPPAVQAVGPGGNLSPASTETSLQELKTMPNLQPISALPTKAPKGLHGSSWKLSPPRLMANSPSHLSEVASLKEVTLSPISESHSEETIPSDSGIGTDNNSTSDQAEKGPASRRRYSFDFCTLDPSEAAAALQATNKAKRGHCPKHGTAVAVETYLSHESLKKQKHRRKRKGLQSRDDLQFLADLEELIGKFQVFRVSHRSYTFYHENSYPSIFRVNFDHYYPVPYFPYDPLHYLRRNSEVKSKKRRGRPAKANEPMTKMPFLQGFGYPIPNGNYYAPYAMPYTSMPIATNMMNLGYYGQYPTPLYLPHTLGAAASPFMRPAVPPPQFHSGAHVKLTATAKHKTKHGTHQGPSTGIDDSQSTLGAPKVGGSCLPSGRLHKRKHKHKHKHKDDQLSGSQREDLGGLFSGAKNPSYLSLLSERLGMSDKEPSLTKHKEKQRHQQNTDALPRSSRNMFEVDTLSMLSLSESQQWKRTRDRAEPAGDFYDPCSRRHSEGTRGRQEADLFGDLQASRDSESSLGGRRRSLESFGVYREQNMGPFKSGRSEKMYESPSVASTKPSPPLKKRFKRTEIEEMKCEVRQMCTFSKILSTKKNLDHVNKILKAKRLQRQAKTGNNIVKRRRRGRPKKQSLLSEEEAMGQMPVLEKCIDLPGKRSSRAHLVPEPLEFSNQDSIMDAIEAVVHMAREQHKVPPERGRKRRHKEQEELRSKRQRKC
ncbi:SET-binding protein-like [Polyodon spathula]|uniref:SET-binding protein-like n=1 Tax=Polyodon spathula TaxID=7913 RepID=UPI001B7EC9C3|nr:SET-binding protein-like [Polyodon spathula]XP_041092401.1 SET-binding protein-like [Polyodon spathula]